MDLFVVKNRREGVLNENDIVTFSLENKEQSLGSYMEKEPGDIKPLFDYCEKKLS